MPYKVKVDRLLCIGSGSCQHISPQTYLLGKDGKSVVHKKDGETSNDFVGFDEIADTAKHILNGAKGCPVNAIVIIEVDEKGNEIRQVWPA